MICYRFVDLCDKYAGRVFFVMTLCVASFGLGNCSGSTAVRSHIKDLVISRCTTTGQFQVGDATIHCGVIRKEVLSETLERKRERLAEECSNYVRGIE